VLTLSYINTALSQSAFRIYKCYIIKYDRIIQKLNTAITTKYMKQVWNKVRIKSTVNVCFKQAKTDRVKQRENVH
jgi:hypothetical protein